MSGVASETNGRPPVRVWSIVAGFVIIFALAAAAGVLFREPLFGAGSWVVAQYGVVGLAVAVLVVDTFPTPMSYVPFMALGLAGGLSLMDVLVVSSVASYAGGCTGYAIGRTIGMPSRLEAWIHRRYPRVQEMLDRYGGWGVAAIALLPVPLAVGTWSAGSLKVNARQAAVALLLRVPKTMVYVAVLDRGLSLGAP